jgi:hypothetical protein
MGLEQMRSCTLSPRMAAPKRGGPRLCQSIRPGSFSTACERRMCTVNAKTTYVPLYDTRCGRSKKSEDKV